MSITLETVTQTITKEERTKEIVISTPKDEDPAITIYRERVTISDGVVIGTEPVGVVVRSLSDMMDSTFVIGDIKLTGGQMALILASIADQLRQEDLNTK